MRRKILYISAAAERGGLEVVLLNTLECLDRTRFTPVVVLLEDGPLVREVEDAGAKVHIVRAGRVRNWLRAVRAITELRALIERERIDLVHTCNAKAHIYGGLAAALEGVPCLYHLHGVPRLHFSRDGVVSLLSILTPARLTVACSRYVAETFAHTWRSDREVVVVHNGVLAPASIGEHCLSLRAEFGVPFDTALVLVASRLQRGKGIHVLLEAARMVVEVNPKVQFIIVGGTLLRLEEDYLPILRDQIVRLELEHTVYLAGHRSDVARFFDAADILVHPAVEPEAFGMALVEAMAASKPVIASGAGGPKEIVEDGVTGLLVPPGSAQLLADAILQLVDDPKRRVKMGEAGARRVRNSFSARRMVERLESLYEVLCCEGKPDERT